MNFLTISSAALINAANHLRLVGDHDAAEALYALTDGHDALVIEGGEPLPRQLRAEDLEQATRLAGQLKARRADADRFVAIPASGVTAEVTFCTRIGPHNSIARLMGFDTEGSAETAVETMDLLEVVSKHINARVLVLESQLRALGVDPA